ncbi:GNAT family N-acetyltransferase [Kitasatospora sp. NPDC049285]|uniref:GNAT family N-acetyltransferase n=1 Tax=Kitasatospora sp. NPDC049285 TaxID=3157096 RepID=UPI0034427958
MSAAVELTTARLRLRQWREDDLEPWAAMNADPEVRRHLGPVLTGEQAVASMAGFQRELGERGWGWWAVEAVDGGEFLGFAGLDPVDEEMPFDGVEIGWRLKRAAWGHGYATEAARAVLRYGFEELGLPEILAVTVQDNLRSRAVMERLGMTYDPADDFLDPTVPPGPLQRGVLYRLARPSS